MIKRPNQIARRTPLTLDQIAGARYIGSPEHKDQRWWGGRPEARVDADGVARRPGKQLTTICPLVTEAERDRATRWVQEALTSGQCRYYEGDKDFPKRLWYVDPDGRTWTGYCVNGVLGQYKGWPITEEERVAIFG